MPVPRIVVEANLWKDPETRFAPSGVAVTDLPLVASTSRRDGEEWVTVHELWLYAKAFGEVAEAAAELKKGDTIFVTGNLVTEQWDDKEGAKQSRTRMLVDSFAVRGKKVKPQGQAPSRPVSEDPWSPQTDSAPPF